MNHGGDVWKAAAALGIAPEDLFDFSANINPRGLPPRALDRLKSEASNPRTLSFYPDPSASVLRKALSLRLDVPPDAIVIGPGAEALLNPALRVTNASRAMVPIPAFSEYRRVCEQLQVQFVPFPLSRAVDFQLPVDDFCAAIQPGAVFLNSPHNPSGAALCSSGVRRILDAAGTARATTILDEAFIDYVPSASASSEAASRPGVIAIRSLTKFYGCPALRVGYAVAHPDTARRIARLLPAWPVTQFAIEALAEALGDAEYAAASILENQAARQQLAEGLTALGLASFPSAANFLLLELKPGMPSSSDLCASLVLHHRILARDCDSYEGLTRGRYVRVAVRNETDNRLLIRALEQELNKR
jgi:threonine-phosphate decarboxylase